MNNNLIYLFGMYEPDTDSIVVYANDSKPFIINCQKCNSSVILDNPDDIVYLYRLPSELFSIAFNTRYLLRIS